MSGPHVSHVRLGLKAKGALEEATIDSEKGTSDVGLSSCLLRGFESRKSVNSSGR